MITQDILEQVVSRARLAPSVHNLQPARWRIRGSDILIAADRDTALPVADPDGFYTGLSCGAAVEATVLALSDLGIGATVVDHWDANSTQDVGGRRLAAILTCHDGGTVDPLHMQLEPRVTWRSAFAQSDARLFGWHREDTVLITDTPTRDWIAKLNDQAALHVLKNRHFRKEFLSWMRLSKRHTNFATDGLNYEALQMTTSEAAMTPLALGVGFGLLDRVGVTRDMVSEQVATQSSAVIAVFHCDATASPVTAGRAYMRMWLEATQLGFSGWPMAALTDDPAANAEVCQRLAITADRRLVQAIRFGPATGDIPARARRDVADLIV